MGLTLSSNNDSKIKKIGFLLLSAVFYYSYEYLTILIMTVSVDAMIYAGVSEKKIYLLEGFRDSLSAFILSILYFAVWKILFKEHIRELNDRKNKYLYSYSWNKSGLTPLKKIIIGVVIGFGICGVSDIWLICAEKFLGGIPYLAMELSQFSTAYDGITAGPYIWTFLSIVLVGPISEELLFRRLIFTSLEKVIKYPLFPIIVSGILFGVWHGSVIQGVYTATMGILVGVVYYKTRDIILTSLIHIVNNINGTLPPPIDIDVVNSAMDIVSYIMIIPMIWLVVFRIKKLW